MNSGYALLLILIYLTSMVLISYFHKLRISVFLFTIFYCVDFSSSFETGDILDVNINLFAIKNAYPEKANIHLQESQVLKNHISNLIEDTSQSSSESRDNKVISIKRKDYGFWSSFTSGFVLIFVSELGDKTFLMSVFFTMKIGLIPTFLTAACTLIMLNAFWLLIGHTLPILIFKPVLDWCAIILFFVFAILLLIEGLRMDNHKIIEDLHDLENEIKEHDTEDNEVEELEENLISTIEKNQTNCKTKDYNEAKLVIPHSNKKKSLISILWGFSMSLVLAECGDKSQLTAIAIAAVYDIKGVVIGSSLAHSLAALIAVSIGHFFSEHISEKVITLIGSCLFFIYAIDFFITTKLS
jgi:Ca2+/H+ antiporter, TMEM165/GDT1 family